MSTNFIRSHPERMNTILQRGADDRLRYFIRSRFIRSLKRKFMEPMDGGLFCPPSCFRSRWPKCRQNEWEPMGTDELIPTSLTEPNIRFRATEVPAP